MNTSVLRTQLHGILRRPGRLLTTGLSVLVAAFVVFGTVLTHQIVTRTTLDTFSNTPPGVSLVIEGMSGTNLTPRQVAEVRKMPGVAQVGGRSTVSLVVGDGSSGTGVDVIADPGSGPLSSIRLVSGTYPTSHREIALDHRTADRLGAAPGTTLRLRTGEQDAAPTRVTVTAVVTGRQGTSQQAYAPDFVVAALSGQPGFPRLDILAAPGANLDALAAQFSAALSRDPVSYSSITTGDITRVAEAKAAVRQYDQIFALVAMFVAIAVVAAALVATSTFRIVFAQRLRQLALLRVIGAQPGQLVRALAVEGAVIGLLAGTVGVLLALAAGLAAPAIAASTDRTLSAPDIPIAAGLAVVIGSGLLTVGAVLAPAFSAAGVAPLQALRDAGTNASERGISAGRLLLGLLLAAATAGLTWRTIDGLPQPGQAGYTSSTILLYLVGSGALAFGTLIVLGPLLIRPVLAVVGRPVRGLGPTGGLAVGGIGGAPRRAAAVSVVVALGVALVSGTVTGTSSLRAWTGQTMAARTPADLAMFSDGRPIPDDVLTRLRADSRLRTVTPFRISQFGDRNASYGAIDIDMTVLPALRTLQTTSGSITDLAPGRAILAHGLSEDLGVKAGDTVTLRSDHGTVRLGIAAVLTGDAPLRMNAVLAPADLSRLSATPAAPSGVLADFGAGSRVQALADFRRTGSGIGADVAVLADERDRADSAVSSLFAAALGLLGLTVLIAVVGVGTTTGLSVFERCQEFGLLRALGLSRSRLRVMIGVESCLYGMIGAVLGITLGVPLAWLALEALNLDLPLTFPAGQLLFIFVTLTAITAVAGLLPARRAARVSPVVAMGVTD